MILTPRHLRVVRAFDVTASGGPSGARMLSLRHGYFSAAQIRNWQLNPEREELGDDYYVTVRASIEVEVRSAIQEIFPSAAYEGPRIETNAFWSYLGRILLSDDDAVHLSLMF